MSDIVLGSVPSVVDERDAIHVAVIPMKASEKLNPGQRVGIVGDGVAGPCDTVFGIVDPFLENDVPKGALFWMCLLPNTVKGMRHHWIHPAFVPDDKKQGDSKSLSEIWLRAYAMRVYPYKTPEDGFQQLIEGLRDGELHYSGSDLHGEYDIDDADDLRHHAEVYLGIRIDWRDFTFSCSC